MAFPARALQSVKSAAAVDPHAELVERVRRGDREAFTALYRLTREDAHRLLYRVVGPGPDLEDLLQETYVQLLKALATFRRGAKFSTFLYSVCAHVGLMHLRTHRRRREDLVAVIPDSHTPLALDPEHAASAHQANVLLQKALLSVEPERRVVFVLYELLEVPGEEIAQALQISPHTVRSRLSRAREELTVALATLRKEVAA